MSLWVFWQHNWYCLCVPETKDLPHLWSCMCPLSLINQWNCPGKLFSKSYFWFKKNIELFSNLSTEGSKIVLQKGSSLHAIGENSAFNTYFLREILKMIGIQRLAGWIENLPASRYIFKDFWRDFLVPVHTDAESQWLQWMMPLSLHLLCSD